MVDYKSIKEIVKKLHEINFGEDGIVYRKKLNDEEWSYKSVINHDDKMQFKSEFEVKSYCTICKEHKACKGYEEYQFKYVSQGAHTFDFIEANGKKPEELITNVWKDTPVIFLMENPSIGYENYSEKKVNDEERRVPKNWYWIHKNTSVYDEITRDKYQYYKSGKYGEMVASLIFNNKLANAYITNAVKCGMSKGEMNSKDEDYIGTDKYAFKTIKTCMKKRFKAEVEALSKESKRVIVFAFGGNAYWMAREFFTVDYLDNNTEIQLVQLPHPAGRMKTLYRKYVLKALVEDVLENPNIFKIGKGRTKIDHSSLETYFDGIQVISKPKNRGFEEDKLCVNYILTDSKNITKEIRITTSIDGKKVGFGYNLFDCEFWLWNYTQNEYIYNETGKLAQYYTAFKEFVENDFQKKNR